MICPVRVSSRQCFGAVIVIPTLLKFHRSGRSVLIAGGGAIGLRGRIVLWELHRPAPVVDVRLFRESQLAAACASIGLSNLVMYTTLLALPLYLERVRNHEVQVSGLILAALSAFSAIWGPLGGRWTDRRAAAGCRPSRERWPCSWRRCC